MHKKLYRLIDTSEYPPLLCHVFHNNDGTKDYEALPFSSPLFPSIPCYANGDEEFIDEMIPRFNKSCLVQEYSSTHTCWFAIDYHKKKMLYAIRDLPNI